MFGVGGGWRTPRDLAFFLSFFMRSALLRIVDGGIYESEQLDHECFHIPGNKARIQAEWIRRDFPDVNVEAVPSYVGPQSHPGVIAVDETFHDGAIVFVQVDNNQSRKLICAYAEQLSDVTVICAGTDGETGVRILVYLRRNGCDLTPRLTESTTPIANPQDVSPAETIVAGEDCNEKVARNIIHPFALMTSSQLQLNTFYEVWQRDARGTIAEFPYAGLYFDIGSGRCRTEP